MLWSRKSDFNRNLLLSKSSTWISLVQEVLFILLATNHFCGSVYLHDILENTTTQIPWPSEHTTLKTKYKAVIQGKEDKTTGRLLGCYYLKESKQVWEHFPEQRRILEVDEQSCINRATLSSSVSSAWLIYVVCKCSTSPHPHTWQPGLDAWKRGKAAKTTWYLQKKATEEFEFCQPCHQVLFVQTVHSI